MGDGVEDPYLSIEDGGCEVYLIRHGDALPDAAEVVLDGIYDSQQLSARGRAQAQALSRRLREVPLAAVFSSPILRARQTAEPTAGVLGLEVRIDAELREVALGPVGPVLPPGASAEEIAGALRARLARIAVIAVGGGYWSAIPGSEPAAELRARATAAVDRIAGQFPGRRIAIVSHAGLINAYIAAMLEIPRDFFFPCANTSISIVRLNGDRRLLLTLNDITHLRPLP